MKRLLFHPQVKCCSAAYPPLRPPPSTHLIILKIICLFILWLTALTAPETLHENKLDGREILWNGLVKSHNCNVSYWDNWHLRIWANFNKKVSISTWMSCSWSIYYTYSIVGNCLRKEKISMTRQFLDVAFSRNKT